PARPDVLPFTTLFRSGTGGAAGAGVAAVCVVPAGLGVSAPRAPVLLFAVCSAPARGCAASPAVLLAVFAAWRPTWAWGSCCRSRSEEHTSELQSRENL